MTNSIQKILREQGMVEGKKGRYPYKEAKLVGPGTDLTKQWVVDYYIWDVGLDKLVRRRIRIDGDTLDDRHRLAKANIDDINRLLKAGYHLDTQTPKAELPDLKPVSIPAPSPATQEFTFADAASYYLKIKSRELREDTTMELYDLYIRHFSAYLKSHRKTKIALKKITPAMANDFIDHIEVGNRFRNNMLGFFKGFFEFFIDREDIVKNPFKKIKNLRVDESDDHRPFTAEQTREIRETILAKGDDQLWVFCQFIYFLFLRPGKELRLLKVGDILEKQVKVISGTAKNRRTGYIDISAELELVIQRFKLRSYRPTHYVFTVDGHPGATPTGVNYFYKRHRKIMEDLELFGHDYDLYSWKPTGAVALYRATKDLLRVQRHCRHSSPDQTYTYLRKHGSVFEGVDLTDFPAIWHQ
ncbi:hypothetical protein [Spirosoma koreense]